ncbi:MAG TPA: energy-coupling factor transporter transmembrane component T [Terriglobales bacterium]|nr:energy-coupling factor transporter transmembrane component T [Terriglobales bacterium]
MTGARAAPLLLGALVGSLVAARFETALACGLVAVAGAALAGARPPRWRGGRLVLAGMALAIVLNALLVPGRRLPLVPHASAEGLRLGALLALRLAGAAAALHGLAAAWPGERAADELARLLRPLERLRVPVAETRAVLGLALRFAPLLATESARIARLQDLRAGRPPHGWRERFVRRRAAMVPSMVNALERAERVSLALDARHHRLRPVGRTGARLRAGWTWGLAGAALAAASLFLRS